jgi:hypothetical protein
MMPPELIPRPLELIESHKLAEVLGEKANARLEASGICTTPDAFYVIFDNRPDIARITKSPGLLAPGNAWLPGKGADAGHEDICYDERAGHFYVLIEAMKDKHGEWTPVVDEYDGEFNLIERRFVDFKLATENKGFEGIAYIYRNDGKGEEGYIALLCEGNFCKGGKEGRTPGGGRVHVFRRGPKRWKHVKQVDLPPWLPFEDYSGIEVLDDYVAVTSQASAMVWVARVQAGETVAFDDGALFEFPRDEQGNVIFCNVEGIAWGGKGLLVTVSDRMKNRGQHSRCAQHDQSIQVFRIPEGRDVHLSA